MKTKLFVIVRNFLEHTSLHGFRFIAERERHWSERFLWVILCATSWVGSGVLFQFSYTAFQENAVSFVVETSYLESNTRFPSVSVCEEENFARLHQKANELFGEDHDNNLDEVLRELAYFKGSAYNLKHVCNQGGIECPRGNFSELARKVRMNCEEIFEICWWIGTDMPFECCKHFVPTETELGTCFTLSDRNEKKLQDRGEPDWLDTTIYVDKPLPTIILGLNATAKVYLHSEYETPFLDSHLSNIFRPNPSHENHIQITIADTENSPEVRELSIYQRKCRFPDENDLQSADFYSYSACVVDCRRRAQMELCNCTSHFTPKTRPEDQCDFDGIICLGSHSSRFTVLKSKWSDKDGLACDCLPGCIGADFDIIVADYPDVPKDMDADFSYISIAILRFPTERYKRVAVRGMLDLVVSIGGAAGLFLGASLLTIVEVSYYFLFQAWTSKLLEENKLNPSEEEELKGENEPVVQKV
ncbi:Amiloride-sensitive sodium channel [Nesidiocoris tenuis]|uniref:Amiloride-sensitive sodium channel n=1 Tax=Nesidiocoris tenuis TaxID=355587 RepID=A0ABN7AY36_9HEMI|nr:Amiloride-sensitive sodium channel [Nesidiocoris tenuis]